MILKRQYWRLRSIYNEYPRHFWTLLFASFIDSVGGFILFPFFTLYVTQKFGVGMTTVGMIFGAFAVTSMVGSTIGGALADRLGRKPLILFGLVVSAISSLWLGLVNELSLFFAGAIFVGLFTNIGGPARQAMIADILPEEQRAQGFGLFRVVVNLAAAIGPAIGGFLASQSYLSLFLTDAAISIFVAILLFIVLPETRIARKSQEEESMGQTLGGYGTVLRDKFFMFFWLASALSTLVYIQMNGTLAVYLRDVHNVSLQSFGAILSLNAGMVVLFQFYITRRYAKYPELAVITVGALLNAIGFALYGFVATYGLFLLAMAIITVGEMLWAPISQSIVARLAPEDMRGRYMAFFGFSFAVPFAIGPLLAGLVIDYYDPNWVWYASGIIGLISAAMFGLMSIRSSRKEALAATAD
ncbi:MAG: MFS transporter [Anaerolineales bacterium]|nr:MFS transporter [Anaerolineales bacterium]